MVFKFFLQEEEIPVFGRLFRLELQRAMNYKFLFLIMCTLLLCFMDSLDFYKLISDPEYIGDTSYVIAWLVGMGMSQTSLYMFVAPAIISLVYTDTLWIDRNTGFINYLLVRSSTRKYISVKYIVAALSGGFIASLPCILLFIIYAILYPLNYTSANTELIHFNVDYYPDLLVANPVLYMVFLSSLKFVFGMSYVLIGLSLSALSNNRYIALSITYVVYLLGTYFGYPYFIPASTFTPNAAGHDISSWFIFKDFITIGILCSGVYFYAMLRKGKL